MYVLYVCMHVLVLTVVYLFIYSSSSLISYHFSLHFLFSIGPIHWCCLALEKKKIVRKNTIQT